jgi:DNA (cytosine-5)-methyltransferase 1
MRVISLFSGAGGMDLGIIRAGHKVIWANDNDKDAVTTYRKNIGNHIVENNIEEINLTDVPEGDVVIGGFPCQGFSCANMRRSKKDERNNLYLEFLRVLRRKKPKFFLAENVRGIVSLEKGQVFSMIIRDFEECGYCVKFRIFNMADYGVPQHRIRVILAGKRKDIPESNEYFFPEPTHSKTPVLLNKKPWVTIGEALAGIPEPDENHKLTNHIGSAYKVTNRDFTGHRKTDPDKPSPTILARGNGKGGVCAIQHPGNHRRLTVRESAIIQTFPIDFVFLGTLNSMYRQVGNAVPVLFAWHLGRQLSILEEMLIK